MNPPLSEIIGGLVQYLNFYNDVLRQTKDPKEKRQTKRKYDRFKKALALLKPILPDWDRGSK